MMEDDFFPFFSKKLGRKLESEKGSQSMIVSMKNIGKIIFLPKQWSEPPIFFFALNWSKLMEVGQSGRNIFKFADIWLKLRKCGQILQTFGQNC
jgi:hypothetical protein